jgi:hypothetical protein
MKQSDETRLYMFTPLAVKSDALAIGDMTSAFLARRSVLIGTQLSDLSELALLLAAITGGIRGTEQVDICRSLLVSHGDCPAYVANELSKSLDLLPLLALSTPLVRFWFSIFRKFAQPLSQRQQPFSEDQKPVSI